MKKFQDWFSNPKNRRELLVIVSGALIVAGLAAGWLLGLPALERGLMAAAAIAAGWDIALRAWRSLRSRQVTIELLVTIATVGALAMGEAWEAAAVTFLFIFGAYLEARTLSHTRKVLQDLLDLAPTTALVLRDSGLVEVLPHEVLPGETVWVKPGAKIAVDGEVVDGRSTVDESAITGEPMPEEKASGSAVFAGTLNQTGLLQVRATGVGADTTLARIIQRVEEAQEEKAPTQRFIERFARWYTPLIIALSGLTYLLTRDMELSLTLLVIGCPGALVISTPVSVVAGIGRAARSGILIKGGEYLENSGKINALALDKTGTLTLGKPRLTEVIPLQPASLEPSPVDAYAYSLASNLAPIAVGQPEVTGGYAFRLGGAPHLASPQTPWDEDQLEVLRWAAIAEASSEHPLARAVLAAAAQAGFSTAPQVSEFAAVPGKGIRTEFEGRSLAVGTAEFMAELGIAALPQVTEDLSALQKRGRTAVLVARDGRLLGLLGISDPLRPSAPELVRRLHAAGVKRVLMLTGDDLATAQTIAAEAGLDEVHANLLPEQKLEMIRSLQAEGYRVAMTGDGINDAPALAAADIGIAMGAAGTSVAIETADIALISDDLLKIPEAIRLSRATLANIRQNVVIALVTVTFLLLGVLLGRVHMAGGMLVHQASVLVVILNGMRLLRV